MDHSRLSVFYFIKNMSFVSLREIKFRVFRASVAIAK